MISSPGDSELAKKHNRTLALCDDENDCLRTLASQPTIDNQGGAVIYLASSEARNSAAYATSHASPSPHRDLSVPQTNHRFYSTRPIRIFQRSAKSEYSSTRKTSLHGSLAALLNGNILGKLVECSLRSVVSDRRVPSIADGSDGRNIHDRTGRLTDQYRQNIFTAEKNTLNIYGQLLVPKSPQTFPPDRPPPGSPHC